MFPLGYTVLVFQLYYSTACLDFYIGYVYTSNLYVWFCFKKYALYVYGTP